MYSVHLYAYELCIWLCNILFMSVAQQIGNSVLFLIVFYLTLCVVTELLLYISWSSWASLWGSRLYIWYPRKLPLLTISRLWCYCGPSNYRFNFLLYWYAPWVFFWGRQCAFVFPIYVRKYTFDRWIVVYTVCASAAISPLRQWLDSYAKTRLKMLHTFKHFIHMQCFLLLTNLVIVFVHSVSTAVLYELRQCSLFWDYIPESKLCFCLNLCRSPGTYSIRPIQKLLNCQWRANKNIAVALSSRNNMISIHQRSVRTNEGKTTLI